MKIQIDLMDSDALWSWEDDRSALRNLDPQPRWCRSLRPPSPLGVGVDDLGAQGGHRGLDQRLHVRGVDGEPLRNGLQVRHRKLARPLAARAYPKVKGPGGALR